MKEKIEKAISQIIVEFPFFSSAILQTEIKICDTEKDFIARINKKGEIEISSYLQEFDISDIKFILLHEILHLLFDHFTRKPLECDCKIWNIATDLAINCILIDFLTPSSKLKNLTLLPQKLNLPSGLSAEEYLKLIQTIKGLFKNNTSQKNNTKSQNNTSQNGTEIEDIDQNRFDEHPSYIPQKEAKEIEEKFQNIRQTLLQNLKEKGNLSQNLIQSLKIHEKSKINWKAILRRFIVKAIQNKTNWLRPNKKLLQTYSIYFPTKKHNVLKISIALDTSASINENELNSFLSEINTILNQDYNYEILLIQCDTEIKDIKIIQSPEKLPKEIKIKGRGGTDFRPVFIYLKENKIYQPLIFFTDLEGIFPANPPDFPVLWVSTTKNLAPFGEIIFLQEK